MELLVFGVALPVYNRPPVNGHPERLPKISYLDKKNCRWQHGIRDDGPRSKTPRQPRCPWTPCGAACWPSWPSRVPRRAYVTLGLPRQNVNYHLKALERHGLVELVEERKKGNMTERMLRATALSYAISPAALGGVQPDPSRA